MRKWMKNKQKLTPFSDVFDLTLILPAQKYTKKYQEEDIQTYISVSKRFEYFK